MSIKVRDKNIMMSIMGGRQKLSRKNNIPERERINTMIIPSVIEVTGRSSRAFDLPTKLLQNRIVYISGPIDAEYADMVVMQLLWLQSDDSGKPIDLYINSPGGSIDAGYAIIDIMNTIKPPVNTLGIGTCASMGALLLAAGTGVRKATKSCRLMVHSLNARSEGMFQDLEVSFNEQKVIQERMLEDLLRFTHGGCSREQIERMVTRDFFMSSEEALGFGFIDQIV